jgi:hypothetical protein
MLRVLRGMLTGPSLGAERHELHNRLSRRRDLPRNSGALSLDRRCASRRIRDASHWSSETSGRSRRQVAEDLGIGLSTLSKGGRHSPPDARIRSRRRDQTRRREVVWTKARSINADPHAAAARVARSQIAPRHIRAEPSSSRGRTVLLPAICGCARRPQSARIADPVRSQPCSAAAADDHDCTALRAFSIPPSGNVN